MQANDILKSDVYRECGERLAGMGYDFTVFPVLFIGENAYQGNSAIERNLDPELAYYLRTGSFRPRVPDAMVKAKPMSWGILSVAAAGLADGVNPCAFTTLVFFISFLTVRGRSRREILLTGLAFAAAIFLSYFAIGFGLLNAFRSSADTLLLRTVLNAAITAVTAIFCMLSIRDYVMIRRGRIDRTVPEASGGFAEEDPRDDPRRRRRHAASRRRAVITGFIVSVLELSCTGQLYLPTIAYMIRTDSSPFGLRSLLVYNIGFILPLLAVFTAACAGVSSQALANLTRKYLGTAKLAMAGVFALLAASVWVF